MAVIDKMKMLTQFVGGLFSRTGNRYYAPQSNILNISKDALIAFVEKYKGIRRIILAIVLWINIHIFLVTIHMYKLTNRVDMQWVIFAGYWAGILGTFVAFYTMARTNEFNSNTPYSRPGEWISNRSIIGAMHQVSDYTERDNPTVFNDNIPEYEEVGVIEIDGDALVRSDKNGN